MAERTLAEHEVLDIGMHLFFVESLETYTADLERAKPTVFFSEPCPWVKLQQGMHAKMPPAKLERLLKIPILRGIVRKITHTDLGLRDLFVDRAALDGWMARWQARGEADGRPAAMRAAAMRHASPWVNVRNHCVEKALATAVEHETRRRAAAAGLCVGLSTRAPRTPATPSQHRAR